MPIKNILVVDDSATDRQFLSDLLMKNGYKVITAQNADEALANLLEPGKRIRGVAVTFVDQQKIPGEAFVKVPDRVAGDLRRHRLGPGDFARFFAPGLELDGSARPHLPASYAKEPSVGWRKISPED